MKKPIEKIVLAICILFMLVGLITGKAQLQWGKVFVLAVMILAAILLAGRDKRKGQKLSEEWKDKTGTECIGVVNSWMRAFIVGILAVVWIAVLFFSFLAYKGGAFDAGASDVLPAFLAVIVILLAMTVMLVLMGRDLWTEIFLHDKYILVKRGRKERTFSWEELGAYQTIQNRVIFFNKDGVKIFTVGRGFQGYEKFWQLYCSKRAGGNT